VTKPARLDLELVRRGLVRSRSEARRAIQEGKVLVRGIPAATSSSLVATDASISLEGPARRFVSRGGDKLEAALDRFDVAVSGRRWLDAGASSGGFTDCLLQRGAEEVVAVDVGYGQFDWGLRNDPRVVLLERVNVRSLTARDLPWTPDAATADLSFISLTQVLEALQAVTRPSGDFVLLVKPQFEVGRDGVGRGGVVRDPDQWLKSIEKIADAADRLGLGLLDAIASPLPGPAGNREFFIHLRAGMDSRRDTISRAVSEATS
jgi:23S rRNA (cytidine1920-2'-O)/16S rRNA (cytidine1409-2'-O)-methyltransferase